MVQRFLKYYSNGEVLITWGDEVNLLVVQGAKGLQAVKVSLVTDNTPSETPDWLKMNLQSNLKKFEE